MNILLIEDNRTDRQLIEKMLASFKKDAFMVKSVTTLADGIKELSEKDYDVLLLDLTLPDSSQEKTLEWMKEHDKPIVIVTGNEDREFIVNALQGGAQDYLIKTKFNKELLRHCLVYAYERWQANQNRVEDLVRKNEQTIQYFKNVVDSASDAIGIATPEGKHFYQNDAFSRMFGLTPDQINDVSGYPFSVYVEESVGREVFNAIMKGNTWSGEVQMRDKNKNKLDILLRAYPIKDKKGDIISLIGIHTDITSRKKTQEELRVIKQQIEFILGATKTNIDIIDSEFNLLYVDPSWQKIYGDPQGRKCYEYFASRSAMCPGCGIPKALETKQIVITEEVLPKEGNRPIQVTTTPFQSEKGDWLVAEVNVDIVERKKLENDLKEKEEKYRIRFDEALDGVVVCNAETGMITDCNKAMARLLRMDKSELIGKSQKILHPSDEHTGKFSRTFEEHLSGKEGQVLEARVIAKDGEIRNVAIKANIFDLRGEKMMLGIFRDISEQKKAEEDLKKNLEDLENFKAMTIDRENKMIELKKEVNKLCGDLGKEAPYDLSFLE